MRTLSLLFALLLPVAASAVPMTLTHQGRLLDAAGAPLTGTHEVVVAIYAEPTGGAFLARQVQTLAFDDGYYVVEFGPLDPATFDEDELYVDVSVGGTAITPRLPIRSVPFAIRADTATRLAPGGVVDVAEIRVDGTTVIDGSGGFVGTVSWSELAGIPADLADGIVAWDEVDSVPAALADGVVDWDEIADVPAGFADGVDHVLTEAQVEGYVTNGALQLAPGSGVAGVALLTADDQLTESDVETFVTNGAIDLAPGSTLDQVSLATVDDLPTGADFAVSDQTCTVGSVVTGVDASGYLLCDGADGVALGTGGDQAAPGNHDHGWIAEGAFVEATTALTTSWVRTQYVDLPAAGRYFVSSNFRIRQDGSISAFVKAELRWTDSAARSTEDRMVCERIQVTSSFNNYGGAVTWVIDVDRATRLEAWYYASGSGYQWYNDSNGVPRITAERVGGPPNAPPGPNWDFESGTTGWSIESGTAFTNWPMATCPNSGACFGTKGITTYLNGEASVGVLVSDPFVISKRWLCWQNGGFKPNYTALDLDANGSEDLTIQARGNDGSGSSGDNWAEQCFDLAPHIGKTARIRLVDNDTNTTFAWASWDGFLTRD